jgi:hypothetical protein
MEGQMEDRNRNRNLFIIVAIVVVLACCLMAALAAGLAAGLAGWFSLRPFNPRLGVDLGQLGQVVEQSAMSFEVGDAPVLQIDNFAGNIEIRTGRDGTITAVASRRAAGAANLQRIVVEPYQEGDTVTIRTRQPSSGISNLAVDLEVTVPPGTRVALTNGAGEVTIDGVEGEISARTGAGNIEVGGSANQVRLETGAGNVDYDGDPQGTSTFNTGAGNIQIGLPRDFAGSVALDTGIGIVDVGSFDVVGRVSLWSAQGTIGNGGDATIQAHTGAGNVSLVLR